MITVSNIDVKEKTDNVYASYDTDYIGEIKLFAFNYTPSGYMSCDGRTLDVMQYQALYALLGTNYGGDGRNTFKLPDLRGAEPNPNVHYCICIDGIFPPRQ